MEENAVHALVEERAMLLTELIDVSRKLDELQVLLLHVPVCSSNLPTGCRSQQ
jgi:hypothetical protein